MCVCVCVCVCFKFILQPGGVPFEINGETCYLRGALTSVVADNPASNLIGGFKNLSSAYRKCRHCLAIFEETQTKVNMQHKLSQFITNQ